MRFVASITAPLPTMTPFGFTRNRGFVPFCDICPMISESWSPVTLFRMPPAVVSKLRLSPDAMPKFCQLMTAYPPLDAIVAPEAGSANAPPFSVAVPLTTSPPVGIASAVPDSARHTANARADP